MYQIQLIYDRYNHFQSNTFEMHKNHTRQQHNSLQDFDLEPITLSYNKRLLDHKKNEIMFNQSMKKISSDYFNQNQQLISQLYSLIENVDVKKNMNGQLMQRVQKILNHTQMPNQNNFFSDQNQFLIQDKNYSSASKSSKLFEHKQKNQNEGLRENQSKNNSQKTISNFDRSQNLFSHKKTCRQNKQNYEHRGTYNLKKDTHKLRAKNKKTINTQNSLSNQKYNRVNKRLKSLENENGLKCVSSSKKIRNKINQRMNIEHKQIIQNQKGVKQRSEQKISCRKAQKPQLHLKYPSSMNTTIFTTGNFKEEIKKEKNKNGLSCKSLLKHKKEKINKIMKNEQKGRLTEQQKNEVANENTLFRTGTSSDQQLFATQENEKEEIKNDRKYYHQNLIQSNSSLGQTYSIQFIDTINKLRKNAMSQQEQLQRKIKELKILISSENYAAQIKRISISKLKQEQHTITANNGFISNKKKQVHKKLESMWGQVKLLNNNILQIQKQNFSIMASVDEEKQLVSMYTTVIEEMKEQLKIQVDLRDEYKKKLNLSKKNQLVSKMKANCTKGQTQLIMSNIRESIGKWIS